MRDALSLTDQAISFGNNSVREDDVKLMLGSIDQREVYNLVQGLIRQDAKGIVEKINQLAEHAPDYSGLLSEMLAVLHRVALAQAVPDGIDNSQGDRELVLEVAAALTPEDVQLFYQIGIVGQRDLPFAPNLKAGFEMILLRMLAFTPFSDGTSGDDTPQKKTVDFEPAAIALNRPEKTSTQPSLPVAGSVESKVKVVVQTTVPADDGDIIDFGGSDSGHNDKTVFQSMPKPKLVPVETPRVSLAQRVAVAEAEKFAKAEMSREDQNEPQAAENVKGALTKAGGLETAAAKDVSDPVIALDSTSWVDVLSKLDLSGVTLSVASNCCVLSVADGACTLQLDETHASLCNETHESRIESAFSNYYSKPFKLVFEVGKASSATPAQIETDRRAAAQVAAVKLIEEDVKIKRLIESFDGTLDRDTITARQ
jgi:DNA polymerase-3 subunit gamma/tau